VFGLTGPSGSGKTTLMIDLIVWFRAAGYRVSAIKHTHHGFDLEQPRKDSWKMRDAGAEEVMLVSNQRWALMREHRGAREPELAEIVPRLAPCDLVLVEGYKRDPIPKIEVLRPSLGKPPIWPGNPAVVAVASDQPVDTHLPVLPLSDIGRIAGFIADRVGLAESRRS
jgi:molybdopterin-guanine dinucleotide biosynthesis protein B